MKATDTFTPPIPVDDLKFGCDDALSREYDWGDHLDQWAAYEASDIECDCGFEGTAVSTNGIANCPECDEHFDSYDDGPMMAYFYPLPDFGRFRAEDAAKLEGLPLCLVQFTAGGWDDYNSPDDSLPEWALALTGGGMDLSWEIAEAHMRLGYLPPLFTSRLPRFAGKDYGSPRNQWIIAGCKRTAETTAATAQRVVEDLNNLTGTD